MAEASLRYQNNTPVRIPLDEFALYGDLRIPDEAFGLVIFVHGSGSSRFSPRNRYVANVLNQRGLATLLLDLLTEEEHRIDVETAEFRFDIPLLGTRSTLVARWALRQPDLRGMSVGLFGASTGAAAALITAAEMKEQIAAVVSRGGRPDLAQDALNQVEAPTLLIVGGKDQTVLDLNERAIQRMHCVTRLHVVPGATHLFEEPGALAQVAEAAGNWFVSHMGDRVSVAREAGTRRRRSG
jgi:pimeloyl-ACP methyl ester carboxylesterase